MWIWLLSFIVTVAIWVAGYILPFPLWLEILLTAAVALILTGAIVARRVRASLKARTLERELLKQAEQQALNARPDRRAEIAVLQAQMKRGLQALRGSRLASREGGALYTLPWYMIIGPPGAGKTTALKHSGLVFPYQGPSAEGGIRGLGGTRNCDWWFTNEAILLDTAGRWATEADDRDEWLAFLDILRKSRSQKPINGVIVAISITDVMAATEEQIDSYAKRLRARFDEMTTRLHMIVPAYVMFTKADLVAGFVEFWGELSKTERAQIWGMTFALSGAGQRDAGHAFDEEFDLLVGSLHRRALRRIGAARQPETRARIYRFPLEFAAIKPNLHAFVAALMQPNAFQEAPILRGVYFSSGTQEGRPVDRVIDDMRRAFNLGPGGAGIQPPPTETKSYFVGDVFERVVIPDKAVASRTRQELRRQSLRRLALSASALALAAMIVVPSISTFFENLSLVTESRDMAERSRNVDWYDARPVMTKVHELDDLRARLDELSRWRKEGVPLRLGWGMYAGDGLYDALRTVYVGSLQTQFAEPARNEIERELTTTAAKPARLNATEYQTCFDRLRAYLEMSDAQRLEPDWEGAALSAVWAQLIGATSPAEKAALSTHAAHYVSLVESHEAPTWHVDSNLVNRVRALLKQTPEVELDYNGLIREASENAEPIQRQNLFVGSKFQTFLTSKSHSDVSVRGAFTRAGWETVVRDRLDKSRARHLADGRWVLGDTQEIGVQHTDKVLQDLRARYFVDYRNAWVAFLADFDLRRPSDGAEALDELTALTENPPPYSKLLAVVADNTRLEQAPASGARPGSGSISDRLLEQARQNETVQKVLGDGGIAEKEKPWVSAVQTDFQPLVAFGIASNTSGDAPSPTGLSHYLQQILAPVVGALEDIKDAQSAPDPHALDQVFREALRGTSELVTQTQSDLTRPLLAPLLMNPLRYSYETALTPVAGDVDRKWGLEVWKDWHDKLEGHYPFSDTGRDASLADYAEFFKPDKGLLWAFYTDNLHATLERDGDTFVPVPQVKWAKYLPDLLRCYTTGGLITTETFPEGADMPLVEFDANVHSVSETVSEVTFEVDGARGVYKNTPEEWFHVEWPSKDPKKRGASLRVRGFDSLDELLARPGDFGLFRLLDGASAIEPGTGGGKAGGAQTVVAKWNLQSQNAWVRMDIRPTRTRSVFTSYLEKHGRMFRDFRCPGHLWTGGPPGN
ncbi:MAG: type VI secretion system membrane subunit TssM [Polyangiaceae bacterium]|jgi:type VI secretion system protein ImpL